MTSSIAASAVRAAAWFVLLATSAALLAFVFLTDPPVGVDFATRKLRIGLSLLMPATAAAALWLQARGRVEAAAALVIVGMFAVPLTSSVVTGLGVYAVGIVLWFVPIMLATLVWGVRGSIAMATFASIAVIALAVTGLSGAFAPPSAGALGGPAFFACVYLVLFVLTAALTRRCAQLFSDALAAQARTQQSLQQSLAAGVRQQQELEAIYHSIPVGLCLVDRELRYLRINEHLARLNGLPAREHIGRTLREAVPDLAEELEPMYRRAMDTGEAIHGHVLHGRTAASPGRDRVWSDSYVPIRDTTGAVVALCSVVEEITEEHAAQRALQTSEQRMRLLLDGAPVALAIFDASMRYLAVSSRWLHDYQLDQSIIGRCHYDVFPDLPERWKQAHQRALAGETIRSEIDRVDQADGRVQWLRWEASPWRQPSGEVGGVMIALEDVSEAVGAGERLRNIVESMPNAVVMVDLAGAISLVNAETERLLGWPREELIGHSVDQLLPAASQPRHAADRAAFFARPDRRPMGQGRDLFAVRKDGQQVAVEVGLNPVVLPEGRFVLAAIVDVTERRHLQDELRRANAELEDRVAQRTADLASALDAAQAATRAKSAFLANMSHELRTPMNAIMGFTALLARETHEPAHRTRLGKIDAASQHLLRIINDVLDLSKIEAGKMQLDVAAFSLDDLAARALELVAIQARTKGLELLLDIDGAPDGLVGDATRLSQAVINLLSNAVKFTSSGWVCLRVTAVQPGQETAQLRFEVSDTGIGIEPAALGRLFGAFEQADSSTSRQHGGTGLGLALTRHIAALHGGEVGVQSEPGQGSRFWFTARVATADAAAPGIDLQRPRRALVAHPMDVARAAIGRQLRRAGLEVDVHPEALGALDLARVRQLAGDPYDLLILAPPPDAADEIPDIRAARRPLGTPGPQVIFLARHDAEALWTRAREAGFDGIVVSPVTTKALRALSPNATDDDASGAEPFQDAVGFIALRSRWSGCRILVAEDNPVNQEVAAAMLGLTGARVDLASDGSEAVERALAVAYDLVLMDVQMPVMDGMQATRAIRAAGQTVPIVAMTANAFAEERQACLAAGMNDHVGKPVDFVRLFATLDRWLPSDRPVAAP